jgi:hypothetical protein
MATPQMTVMERIALTRLRRFEKIAQVAEQSESPLWQKLAHQAAKSAYRDALLAGLDERTIERRTTRAA